MDFMMYKGYPLVRKGNDIYFGYMSEPYVIWLQAEDAKEEKGVKLSHKVRFYQMKTDENLNPIDAIVKNGERPTLYDALEVASTWLRRANQS
ncbi:MAG: hypothetical protein K6F80_07115 [Oscillospiraceae bacterium]|nr:hypothetical protein [Oscillospiraceae bacterium]